MVFIRVQSKLKHMGYLSVTDLTPHLRYAELPNLEHFPTFQIFNGKHCYLHVDSKYQVNKTLWQATLPTELSCQPQINFGVSSFLLAVSGPIVSATFHQLPDATNFLTLL